MKQQKTTQTFPKHQKDNIKEQKKRDTFPETSESLDETKEDNTDIWNKCNRQGSTTEYNRKMLHKEDRKERIQGQDAFHRQRSTTKDHTKISHREDGKKNSTMTSVSHATFYNRKKQNCIAQKRSKKTTQGQVSQTPGSTTEDNRKIANKEDKKQTAQGQVSHRQGSTTEDKKKVSQREDGKETAQGRVSYRQGSTTEDKRKIAN